MYIILELEPIRSYIVKESHIGSAVRDIDPLVRTDRQTSCYLILLDITSISSILQKKMFKSQINLIIKISDTLTRLFKISSGGGRVKKSRY